MTRLEREELLRRYLEGEMSTAEEHEFLITAALDKELRHELQGQQTIDRAFQKDRTQQVHNYAALQASVSAMLAGIPVGSAATASSGIGRADRSPSEPDSPEASTGEKPTGVSSWLRPGRLYPFMALVLLLIGLGVVLTLQQISRSDMAAESGADNRSLNIPSGSPGGMGGGMMNEGNENQSGVSVVGTDSTELTMNANSSEEGKGVGEVSSGATSATHVRNTKQNGSGSGSTTSSLPHSPVTIPLVGAAEQENLSDQTVGQTMPFTWNPVPERSATYNRDTSTSPAIDSTNIRTNLKWNLPNGQKK